MLSSLWYNRPSGRHTVAALLLAMLIQTLIVAVHGPWYLQPLSLARALMQHGIITGFRSTGYILGYILIQVATLLDKVTVFLLPGLLQTWEDAVYLFKATSYFCWKHFASAFLGELRAYTRLQNLFYFWTPDMAFGLAVFFFLACLIGVLVWIIVKPYRERRQQLLVEKMD